MPTQPDRPQYAHASMMVDDLAVSAEFITGTLGFRTLFGPVEIGVEFSAMTGTQCGKTLLMQFTHPLDGMTVELVSCTEVPGIAQAAPPLAHIAFTVPDLDVAIAQACGAGAVQMGQVTAFSEGKSVYLRAPGGAVIEFEELFV